MNESRRPEIADLTAFAAIAAHRSFRKAADELGVSPSTLSHLMRDLEQRLAVRLLHRTTRSVSPTEAGARLLERLRPVLRDLDLALEEVDSYRRRPGGTVRINSGEIGARLLLDTVIPAFRVAHPEVHVDLVADGTLSDIVAGGFDAGVRLLEAVPEDMIAVPFGGGARFVAVASKAYLSGRTRPKTPDDLKRHECIRFRMPSGKMYRWEFERRGRSIAVDVHGALTLDDVHLMAEAARRGLGVAFVAERVVRRYVAAGELEILLGDWSPEHPGLCLYYPGHRHVPPALRAFVDVLKGTAVP
jgi:DNA-binding transcriptional LysR family regulator